ncbi:MAG: class I SAM-dependent methyltransferase [Bacteroidota bacterium]
MKKNPSCKVCSSAGLTSLGKSYPEKLMRCKDCGLIQFIQDPSEEELNSHYGNYPVSGGVSDITIKRYEEILDTLEPYRVKGRLLDVGCGEGFFLEVAKRRGWEVHGTEFSPLYIPICESKGINMKFGRLNPDDYTHDFFDVITWFEVIEHINNPNKEIESFRKIIRPEGAVYVTTPNINSISRILLKGKWTAITYPDHLCYYSPFSIKKLFLRYGFHVVSLKTTGVSIGRIKDSLRNGKSEKPDGFHETDRVWQERFEKKGLMHLLKFVINHILDLTGKGDSLKVLFRLDKANA